MSWRYFRDRFMSRPLSPSFGSTIVTASLRRAAEEYVRYNLPLGAEIHEGTDAAEIAPFRHLLPGLLARRGLCLEQTATGWRVIASPFPPPQEIALECTKCHGNWFSCSCGIGVQYIVNPQRE